MYLKSTCNNIRKIMEKLDNLDSNNQIKFISHLLNLWNNDLINNLNVINPSFLDDDVDIKIFNPNSIGYSYMLIKEIIEYLNVSFKLYQLYPNNYISLIKMFAEIFLLMEQKSFLPSNIDGYEIARLILKY